MKKDNQRGICGKVPYPTHATAQLVMTKFERSRHDKGMTAYWCEHCRAYHIGHDHRQSFGKKLIKPSRRYRKWTRQRGREHRRRSAA